MNIELIKKIRKPVLIVTGVISAYALAGFVALPKLIESQLPKIIETETGRKATLERMEFNPFTLKLSLQGFSMQEKDLQTFVAFGEFFVDVEVWESIREFALVLSDIRLSEPYVRLEELKDKQFNFSDLLTESTEEEEVEEDQKGGIFPLIIHQLTIAQGTFKRVDATYSKPVESLLNDIDLQLEEFSTLPDKDAQLGFSLGLNSGGVLRWQGDFGVNPVFSNGRIEIEGLRFPRIWTLFLQNKVNFQWVEGTQLIKFDYALSYADDNFVFSLTDGQWLTENLKFTEPGGQQALIDIPYFAIEDIDFDLQKQTVTIAKITSKDALFDTSLDATGQLNYQTLFAMNTQQNSAPEEDDEVPEPSADKDAQPWDLNIQQIALNGSKINFHDNSHKAPVVAKLEGLDLGINSTHVVAGELLDVDIQDIALNTSNINFSDSNVAQPLAANVGMLNLGVQNSHLSSGELLDVNVQEIVLKTANISLSDKGHKEPVLVDVGELDLGLQNYHLSTGEALQMLANQGYLDVQKLDLKTKADKSLVNMPSVNMAGLDLNFQEKHVKIDTIKSSDALIKAWLEKNGTINYQTLFAPLVADQGQEAVATQAQEQLAAAAQTDYTEQPWVLELNEFKFENYALQFKDYTPDKPVSLDLSALDFSINQFSNQPGAKLPLTFSTTFNKAGTIKVSGATVLEPFSSDLSLSINQIGISAFEPYINQFARLDIINGNFNTQGKLSIAQPGEGDLKLRYRGGVDINKLHTRDHVLNQDFLKWQQLKFRGLDFNLQPSKLKIKSIHLDKPYARVTIKKDKTTNIDDVLIAQKAEEKDVKTSGSAQQESPFVYDIGAVKIVDGESDFSDFSLILPFVVALNDLDGDINSISSNQKTKTKVALTGKVFDLSPIDIKGGFTADLDNLDIGMHFKSLPLPFISPYMVEFAGNKIKKGKMSLDLIYQVKDKRLTAKNNLLIDQLELGEEVENPDAVDLPLSLAIALLKDKEGRITVNMPLEGSMDDPEFSVGPLVLDAFINLLTKVVASPFTALGSFLGSDDDFSVVSFEPGSAEITAKEHEKIAGLSTALLEKPELSLEVEGVAYTNQDWPAMNEQALMDQLKQIRSDELKKEGEIKLAEYIELSEDDYERLLADLFIQTFPELGKRSIFGTPKLIYPDMGEFNTVAKNMLQGMIKPNVNKLRILSLTRARNIARLMVKEGGVEQPRIFILDGKVQLDSEEGALNANLTLKVQ